MFILQTAMEAALRSTLSAGHLSAVLLNYLNIFGHNAGSAVQHYGETGQAASHFFKYIKTQLGLALEFICAVAGAYGYGQGINSRSGYKFLYLFRTGIAGIRF